ncbi:MAG: DUF4301 family protein [Tannerella sp.]|jgi:hypothetical protein|nr:DUF4301 family protein [Tannerella sp.]
MLIANDLIQLKTKNLTQEQVEEQLNYFIQGFPFLEIKASASIEKGIVKLSENEQDDYIGAWEDFLCDNNTVVKFVPASGAASRMFKDLFSFLSAEYDTPATAFEKKFFDSIELFAFYKELNGKCLENEGKDIATLMKAGDYKTVVSNLLDDKGLRYGSLPKGLLLFHEYPEGARAAMEEHLVEGALYAAGSDKNVNIHFTVSPEHQPLFERLAGEKIPFYEAKFGVKYHLSFSVQQSNTDTVAVDLANAPFRDVKGKLVFRPGGHGALIRNLNDIDADVVFIKNIDNVVPDSFKGETIRYKKVIAGALVSLQKRIFEYVRLIESGDYTHEQIEDMIYFLQDDLCIKNPDTKYLEDVELVLYIKRKLMRPLRVCGMVRNEGEPGGGPFITVSPDGAYQLQILESSQIDMSNEDSKKAFEKGSHFNPVDLVCALKDAHGNKYNLPDFVDKNTGFISQKSKDGRNLKALELPGLWNGAMSDWNTVFVEVPIETFNPVKTVNDLIRPQHQ